MIKRFFHDIYFDVTGILVLFLFVFHEWDGSTHQIIGTTLAILSFTLWITSRLQLGNSFSITPKASHLITNGIYSRIRHPMYLFSFSCLLGLFIAINNYYLYPPLIVLAILQIMRARKENFVLRSKFGEEYKKYYKETWF